MGINYTGLAAAEALDALLTRDDFEPEQDVDTVALDATIEALAAADAVIAALTELRKHLADGGDADTARGLSVDARLAVETLDGLTAGIL
jgi:hypothetical protein